MAQLYSRRKALGLGLASVFAPSLSQAASPPVFVELFTSQGCADCVAADELAGQLRNRPGLRLVSLNVDYWDYLGWRDTLGKPQHSQRQQDYAKARGDRDVYTPQLIINGENHVVGSNQLAAEAAIRAAQTKPAGVTVSASVRGNAIEIAVGPLDGQSGTLWLMGISPEVRVKIERGENNGKTITYHNAVRNLVPAGSWVGSARTFSIARAAVVTPECSAGVAILQSGHIGRVLGLADITLL